MLGFGQEAGKAAVPVLSSLWSGLKTILNFKVGLLKSFNEAGKRLPAKVADVADQDIDFSFFLGK